MRDYYYGLISKAVGDIVNNYDGENAPEIIPENLTKVLDFCTAMERFSKIQSDINCTNVKIVEVKIDKPNYSTYITIESDEIISEGDDEFSKAVGMSEGLLVHGTEIEDLMIITFRLCPILR